MSRPLRSRTGQRAAHSPGASAHARITAWQDAIIDDYLGSGDPLPVYLAGAGTLTARVQGASSQDHLRGHTPIWPHPRYFTKQASRTVKCRKHEKSVDA